MDEKEKSIPGKKNNAFQEKGEDGQEVQHA